MAKNKDKIIIAIILGCVFVGFIGFVLIFWGMNKSIDFATQDNGFSFKGLGGKIALIEVNGVIEGSDDVVRQVIKYQKDNTIKGIVLRVDSPGGGVAASQEIYDQLRKYKEDGKHVVVSMGSVAASGGYYISCASDSIVANPGTITGSIGVIFSFHVLDSLLNKVGVRLEVFKSGKMKDVGNYDREVTNDERKMLQSVIDDTYEQFVNVVADSRGLEVDEVKSLADGSIYTGQQALDLGLVDKLGTLQDAISLAGEMCNLGDNPIVIKERRTRMTWWEAVMQKLGIDPAMLTGGKSGPSLEYRFIP
jgi:protease-4